MLGKHVTPEPYAQCRAVNNAGSGGYQRPFVCPQIRFQAGVSIDGPEFNDLHVDKQTDKANPGSSFRVMSLSSSP